MRLKLGIVSDMRMGPSYYRRCIAAARVFALLMLVCALLAPKVSLAVAATFGSGYSTVIICTGGGLARVSVSPQGDVVGDVSEAWTSAHCVLQDERTSRLERVWQSAAFPEFAVVSCSKELPLADSSVLSRQTLCNRGPPARG